MSQYLIGAKAIKRLVAEQNPSAFYQAKLSNQLFRGVKEVAIYEFAHQHYEKFQVLPQLQTLEQAFPDLKELETPEPAKYYVDLLENRYGYDLINQANVRSQELLKKDQGAILDAEKVLRNALDQLVLQRTRQRVLDVGSEGAELLLQNYHGATDSELAYFGWPYMDEKGGVGPGNTVSFIGRPAMGKTFKMLHGALYNWKVKNQNVLFVSPEMSTLEITQRLGAMYAGTNVTQLYTGSYATPSFELFVSGLEKMQQQPAKFYVVDTKLAATIDDVFALAKIYGCKRIWIDGAYMMKHRNERLGKWDRIAENVELTKKYAMDTGSMVFQSYQFNKKVMEKGKGAKKNEKPGLEDIFGSDAIAHYSSIVLGIFGEDGVEAMVKRWIDLLKGRKGEVGRFPIHWDFDKMDFTQYGLTADEKNEKSELEFV